MKKWLRDSAYLGLIVIFASTGVGCASTQETTKTETTVTYPDESTSSPVNQGVVAKSETTTTTTDVPAENPGVLSSALHAVGYVLILPFIIVGGIFKIIFGG